MEKFELPKKVRSTTERWVERDEMKAAKLVHSLVPRLHTHQLKVFLRVALFLQCPPRVLGVLAKHGPVAFGGAFAVGLDGSDFFIV